MKRYLEKGYTLQRNDGGKYVITEMIGRGSSCAVYHAEHYTTDDILTEHLLKEYNPRAVSITRTNDGMMCVSAEERDAFSAGLDRFQAGYEKQLDLRQTDELRNSTSNIQNIFDANGTRYIDMTLFTGSTYSDIHEQSLYDLCRRMKAVTQVVGNYHKAGLLHLDIKPENIFAIPETCELVMLFDFDSVVEKNCIERYTGLSYTKTWAAPEQVIPTYRKKICEATDLYAIGEMMFWQIFDRHSEAEERRSFFTYQFDTKADIFKNTNPKVFTLLSDLLHHTITTSVANRYQSAEELIAALDELIKLSDPKEPYLVSTSVTAEAFFIGRENELRQIHEMLSVDNVLYLCGMGGIGKSELARNYVKQYRKDYDTVFFATYMGSWSMLLTDDYHIQIANFHSYEGEKPEGYCARKLRKLKELCDERTLFVIDNVNEDEYDESENECFKQIMALPCRFLFTSRYEKWNRPVMKIEGLSNRSNLVKLFQHWCPIKDEEQRDAVNEIIDYVESHTLALELIAKQTKAGFSTPAKMLAKLQEHGMRDSGKEKIRSDKDLTATEKRAFDHICDLYDMAELTDGEKYVMANMALLPSTGIDENLFKEWCELEDFDDINSLIANGWIDEDENTGIIKLHPVIKEVSLINHYDFNLGDSVMLKKAAEYLTEKFLSFTPAEKKYYADFGMEIAKTLMAADLRTDNTADFLTDMSSEYDTFWNLDLSIKAQERALDVYKENHGDEYSSVGKTLSLLGITYNSKGNLDVAVQYNEQALTILKELFGIENSNVATVLDNLGIFYKSKGDLDTAQRYCEQALTIRKKLFGEDHPDVTISLNNLGAIYEGKGDLNAASKYYAQGLTICKKLYGEEHPDVATSLNNLGTIYESKGDLDTAQRYFEQALAIRKKFFGEEHPYVAKSLSNLGTIYKGKGTLDIAIQYHERALAVYKKLYGEDHPDTATFLSNLGVLYNDKGDLDMALQYSDQALTMRKKLYGEDHPNVAISLNNLGTVYKSKGDLDTAQRYCEQALAVYKKLYGEEHPDVATSLSNLGILYNDKGDLNTAIQYSEQALTIRKKLYGEDHPDVATSLNNLGTIYESKGDLDAAQQFFEQALAVYKKLYGEEHPDVATSLNNLGVLYRGKGDLNAAIQYFEQALAIRKKLYKEEHPEVAILLSNLGVLYDDKGNLIIAKQYHEKALAMRIKLYGEEHPDVATSLNNLGVLYRNRGNLDAAQKHFERALAVYKKLYGEDHPDVATSLSNLGILYNDKGDLNTAIQYSEQALTIRKKLYGEEHPDVVISLGNLGVLYKSRGDVDIAQQYIKKALTIRKKLYGEEHLEMTT